ncbi:AAA family ATPase [Agrobacterium rosae]|uniref:ABC-type enterochelin transport system, ATPase component n=1 Tax=Agrobacterium rosae TaxID=1972867 RepID=A0A1R3U0R9_9HYPH|nr:AAA family ATPase [Agrobacterium rosae]SCX34546.1 ABC-type enterochelin transport system, ATPase component [Agrobacterium rosae]
MGIDRIQLLRNIGQFDNVSSGAGLPFGKLTILYGENGRGKTTLAAILRSLATNDAALISERQRLGAQHPPHIIINRNQAAASTFQNGGWNSSSSDIAVFDDAFVAQNVCSGLAIDTAHRQNLHELILGSQGVQLNVAVVERIADVERHIRLLRERTDAIPATMRLSLTVEQFCALQNDPNVDSKIEELSRNLAAARSADEIQKQGDFLPPTLPSFDIDELDTLLQRDLADLESTAAASVQEHFSRLGAGAETWVSQGMPRVAAASAGADHEVCPFCTQNLAGSEMISHYRAYFSAEYQTLKNDIAQAITRLNAAHGGDIPAAFERGIATAVQTSTFWKRFGDSIPEIVVDTAAVARAWTAARQAVLTLLREKQASPLEPVQVPEVALHALAMYEEEHRRIAEISAELWTANGEIALVKERAAGANLAALNSDLQRLGLVQTRHSEPAVGLCAAYIAEKQAKTQTEQLRDQARNALEQYRLTVFPAYQTAINTYLQRFNAGFRIGAVASVNSRNGSSANYNVVINENPVTLSAEQGPSFRNTLSAGDRNTLALAFFFASLDRDPAIANKIVVIDDPMTSLDEHRSLTTVHEMRLLCARVNQMVVLSHSKPFLLAVWNDADRAVTRTAIRVARQGAGSTLTLWDVNHDAITEHDKRHAIVAEYIVSGGPTTERVAAQALRPILEAFLRVAYPAHYPPGTLLGPFLHLCQQRVGMANEILSQADMTELEALKDFGNRFHHDSNAAWETQAINDQELVSFCQRTLAFARR